MRFTSAEVIQILYSVEQMEMEIFWSRAQLAKHSLNTASAHLYQD